MEIKYDGEINLATGVSRMDTHWKNRAWQWSELVQKLSETQRTHETVAEFNKLKKSDQDRIKDVGGFVGGYVKGGNRKASNIVSRQLLTLDLDFAQTDVWDTFCLLYQCAACIYSTHKHTPEMPRLRLIIPLSREVFPEEYQAIARRVAGVMGIDMFDDTTYEPSRLMYWPSTPKDGEFLFEFQDGAWLDADNELATYKNWKDTSEWPVSSRVNDVITRSIKKQGDPLEKNGIVGAFCRTYDIHQAIEKFLPDEYTPCAVENRYTYTKGSTAAGLVVYDDKFAYSHHGTDPTSGKLCNAFDLVRIHLYGDMDENVSDRTNITKYPSYIAMEEFATKDKDTVSTLSREKVAAAGEDFAGITEDNDDWLALMDTEKKGAFKPTYNNFELILRNDPKLKGRFAYDLFNERKALKRLPPWRDKNDKEMYIRDDDEANLRLYLSKEPWCLEGKPKISDAFDTVCRENAFHPVRDYFNKLYWDGVSRLDTLFIDYLGAEDTELNRWITRIAFTAAVYRAFEPGTKYDQIVVLVGTQGCGKSTVIERMAANSEWFSNSMPSPDDATKAASHLRGKFIIEIGELVGFRKAEVEAIKNFLSKTADDFRPAWGKNELHRLRQCIFFATTNEEQFLRDSSGERRYWPIQVAANKPKYNLWEELMPATVEQLWAEAIEHYKERMPLVLPVRLDNALQAVQEQYKQVDDWIGIIENFLERKLPTDWNSRSTEKKKEYFKYDDPLSAEGTVLRNRISIPEILNECIWLDIKSTPGKAERSRISACMKAMKGWVKTDRDNKLPDVGYGRQRGWIREDTQISENDTNSIFDGRPL